MTAPRQSGRPAPEALDEALRANPTLNAASIDGTVLAPIVAYAFRRLEDLPEATEAAVRAALKRRGGARAGTFFAGALRAPGRRVILEVKAASPSRGLMRSEIDLADYARTLNRFADAVSVLTEPKFFGGSFERLAALRPLVAKPLLAKDFFIDERQALAAAEAGADAILLMLSVLSDAGYRRLAAFADRLGLEVLTEASTPDELERARALGARVIGVNNRNLRTLEVDLSRAPALAAGLPLGPDAPVVVAESGYRTAADMEAACAKAPAIAAFLCGSALSLSKDLSTGVRELLHGRSKVCGITRAGDALAAAEAGATSVGVILAERSRRCVAPDEAAGLASAIRGKCIGANLPVELCAVADAEELERPALLETLRSVAPDVLQIHGAADAFSPEFLSRIAKHLPGVKLAPALGLGGLDEADAQALARRIRALLEAGLIDRAVLDNSAPGTASGGTGRRFNPALLEAFRDVPRLVVAGGLAAENAREAFRRGVLSGAGVLGLDFNSGVEIRPGVKDAARIRETFAALRGLGAPA